MSDAPGGLGHQAEHDDPTSGATLLVGFVGTCLFVFVVLYIHVLFENHRTAEERRKQINVAPAELMQYRAEQEALLHGYRWVDEEAGVVQIPIERAMELVVAESGGGPS